MSDDRIARRLVISGRVQGVWYRGWTVDQARALGLDGWVRNRNDGTVEIVVAGPADAVERLTALCEQGPRDARVDGIEATSVPDPGATGFGQRATV